MLSISKTCSLPQQVSKKSFIEEDDEEKGHSRTAFSLLAFS